MLKDKVVVITGAGSGLGRELAKAFCLQGSIVLGVGRSPESLNATKDFIGDDKFEPSIVDVAHASEIQNFVQRTIEKHGRIDIVFNNAAVYPKVNFLSESAEAFAQAVGINVCGVANMCKAVLPSMIEKDYGRIFNLGSWADLGPIADSAAYSCTKGAMHALTKAIAADIADKNVDVEIHEWIPGHLNTQMSDYTGMDPAVAAAWGVDIASRPHASKKNCIFEQNWEWQPPKSLKQKVVSKLLFWK